jgi:hypothetical protein
MYTRHRTRLRKLILKHQPVRHREPEEDSGLTLSQQQAFMTTLYQRSILPIMGGQASIQDVFLPPDGWQGSHEEWLSEFV